MLIQVQPGEFELNQEYFKNSVGKSLVKPNFILHLGKREFSQTIFGLFLPYFSAQILSIRVVDEKLFLL